MMFILGEWLDRLKAVCCEQSHIVNRDDPTTITAYSAAIQGP